MKQYVILIIVFFVSIWSIDAQAATGTIEIQLQDSSETKVFYTKVATMKNGLWKLQDKYQESGVDLHMVETADQTEKAAQALQMCSEEALMHMASGKEKVCLENLETGLYLLTFAEDNSKVMKSTLVSVPSWAGKELTYNVKVIPKSTQRIVAPKTGDGLGDGFWQCVFFGLGGILLILIVLCKKRRNILRYS